jgi:hypothetical protein
MFVPPLQCYKMSKRKCIQFYLPDRINYLLHAFSDTFSGTSVASAWGGFGLIPARVLRIWNFPWMSALIVTRLVVTTLTYEGLDKWLSNFVCFIFHFWSAISIFTSSTSWLCNRKTSNWFSTFSLVFLNIVRFIRISFESTTIVTKR